MTKVIYSPQPDEPCQSSAAFEYAKRVSSLVVADGASSSHAADAGVAGDVNNSSLIVAERLTLQSLDFLAEGNKEDDEQHCPTYIFIVSCAADGSVDRIVRKLIRNLKSSTCTEKSMLTSGGGRPKVAIALLGHARCENSANQMKDTIFANGRRLRKGVVGVLGAGVDINVGDAVPSLEVQVELEPPEVAGGFDEWIKALWQ